MRYYSAGLDLGQATDYSALAIAERIPPPQPGGKATYHVRYLERLKLGMPYPEQVAHVKRLLEMPPLKGHVTLALDYTGVGRPVADMFRQARIPCRLYLIGIHGGEKVLWDDTDRSLVRVPKRDLVAVVQVLLQSGRLKIAVVDPRHSRIAAKAWKWVPVKPGEDAALAMAMIRWIIENERYDRRYLENCNRAAASFDGEPTWTNAAWLVKIRPDGSGGAFLRAGEIGRGGDADTFVCLRGGTPVAFKSDDAANPVEGDLFVDTTIDGIRVKSAMQLLYEEASRYSLWEWAEIAGVRVADIVALASEFTSHGKRAVVEIHRGVSQHTNGFYNVLATLGALNLLVGNFDWKGGLVYGGGAYGETGGSGRPFQLSHHPARLTP
ncbi:MAG: molybdopterin-dependent oxidoreductase, partial [Bryobacteraceae bacterium]|nr:molybdopterin-dependent oxidoreductase [Bryobacteraceae bacterium]